MKLHYYPETDSLYIDLVDRPSSDSHEVVPGVVLDVDEKGQPVGLDIQHASHVADLSRLDALELPIASLSLARSTQEKVG